MRSVLATESYKNRALFEKDTFRKGDRNGATYPQINEVFVGKRTLQKQGSFHKAAFRKRQQRCARQIPNECVLCVKRAYKNRYLSQKDTFRKGNKDARDKSLMNVFSWSKEPIKTEIFLKKTLFEKATKMRATLPQSIVSFSLIMRSLLAKDPYNNRAAMSSFGVATIGRLLKIVGLFWRISSLS